MRHVESANTTEYVKGSLEFQPQEILSVKSGAKVLYRVRWHDTWEPAENLLDSVDLLAPFSATGPTSEPMFIPLKTSSSPASKLPSNVTVNASPKKVHSSTKNKNSSSSSNSPFVCPQCGIAFANRNNLRRHVKHLHEGQPYKKNYTCDLCGYAATTNHTIAQHMTVHTGAREYMCDICGKAYPRPASLSHHRQAVHFGFRRKRTPRRTDLRFLCTQCPFKTDTDANLERHVANEHICAKTCVCEHCGKAFWVRKDLSQHVRRWHTPEDVMKERKHICSVCGKGFVSPGRLTWHMQLAHTVGRNLKCEECGKTFKANSNLVKHKIGTHGKKLKEEK